jgi:hypothetical protein
MYVCMYVCMFVSDWQPEWWGIYFYCASHDEILDIIVYSHIHYTLHITHYTLQLYDDNVNSFTILQYCHNDMLLRNVM